MTCQPHPEGGLTHDYAYCFCSINEKDATIKDLHGKLDAADKVTGQLMVTIMETQDKACESHIQELAEMKGQLEAAQAEVAKVYKDYEIELGLAYKYKDLSDQLAIENHVMREALIKAEELISREYCSHANSCGTETKSCYVDFIHKILSTPSTAKRLGILP